MSDILIHGMEMPDIGCREIRIYPGGHVIEEDECGRDEIVGTAEQVPPHGRLIDADALYEYVVTCADSFTLRAILRAPTIIPADEGGDAE